MNYREIVERIEEIGRKIERMDNGKRRILRRSMTAIKTLIDDTQYITDDDFVDMLEDNLRRLETKYKNHKRSIQPLVDERIELKQSIRSVCKHNQCLLHQP